MPIRVECPGCGATLQVDDRHAGRRGKCPRCQAALQIPAPTGAVAAAPAPASMPSAVDEEAYGLADTPAAAASARMAAARAAAASKADAVAKAKAGARPAAKAGPARTPAEILAGFRGEIRPVRPTLLYRAWILVVAAVMVLLPAIYVGLVALVGYGLVWHAVQNVTVFESVRSGRAAALIYLAPLIIGAIVLGFMLKPLFARPARRPKVRALDPSKEPLLFAFVDGICSSVGAPTPARIEVDCRVNASAHLASGPLAPGRTLVLTIGLPLAEGLTLRQFAGVLAHEFGHFAQGAGMRLSQLIWSINRWFARVVYERDAWDEALEGWSSEGNLWAMMVIGLARVAVWLTRRVLWVLMQVGRVVSGVLSRQMEYDADRYEARMVGSATFAETSRRMGELSLAEHGAFGELQSSWRERRLPDDLPRLIVAHAARIPEPVRDQFLDAVQSRRTGLFDTHPSDRDRIARAQAEGAEGIFTLSGPATALFRDFDALARAATFDHYRSLLGPEISKDQLYPLADALLDREVAQEGGEAFGRFFLQSLGPHQGLPLPAGPPSAPADLKAARRDLVAARDAMRAAAEANRAALERLDEVRDRAAKAEAALALLKAGNRIAPAAFGLDRATEPAAEKARDGAAADLADLARDLGRFADAAARRMVAALAILESDAAVARVPAGALRRDEARALYPCAAHLGTRVVPALAEMALAARSTGELIRVYQEGKDEGNRPRIDAVLRGARRLHERLTELRWKVGDGIPYPFEHAREGIGLARYALPEVPEADAVGDLMGAGGEAHDRLLNLHLRVLGRLALACEAVERVLGLPPLPAPGDQPDGEAA